MLFPQGSERATASDGRNCMRLEEAKAINLSLSALGNCMNALAEGRMHVPYRDSKLTRLLQGCLGGGARTSIIVTIPPGCDDNGEALNALRFASRASKVKVAAKVMRFTDFEGMYNEAHTLPSYPLTYPINTPCHENPFHRTLCHTLPSPLFNRPCRGICRHV